MLVKCHTSTGNRSLPGLSTVVQKKTPLEIQGSGTGTSQRYVPDTPPYSHLTTLPPQNPSNLLTPGEEMNQSFPSTRETVGRSYDDDSRSTRSNNGSSREELPVELALCTILATSALAETSVAENSLMIPGRSPFLGLKPCPAQQNETATFGRPPHSFDPSRRRSLVTGFLNPMAGVDEKWIVFTPLGLTMVRNDLKLRGSATTS